MVTIVLCVVLLVGLVVACLVDWAALCASTGSAKIDPTADEPRPQSMPSTKSLPIPSLSVALSSIGFSSKKYAAVSREDARGPGQRGERAPAPGQPPQSTSSLPRFAIAPVISFKQRQPQQQGANPPQSSSPIAVTVAVSPPKLEPSAVDGSYDNSLFSKFADRQSNPTAKVEKHIDDRLQSLFQGEDEGEDD